MVMRQCPDESGVRNHIQQSVSWGWRRLGVQLLTPSCPIFLLPPPSFIFLTTALEPGDPFGIPWFSAVLAVFTIYQNTVQTSPPLPVGLCDETTPGGEWSEKDGQADGWRRAPQLHQSSFFSKGGRRSSRSGCSTLCSDVGSSWNPASS